MLSPQESRSEVPAEEVRLVARASRPRSRPRTGSPTSRPGCSARSPSALTGVEVDYRGLEPLAPTSSRTVSRDRDLGYRQRIVHHMVLGELVLRPLPVEVAHRVATYAEALGRAATSSCAWRGATRRGRTAWPGWTCAAAGSSSTCATRRSRTEPRTASRPDPFEPATVDPDAGGAVARVRGAAARDARPRASGSCTTAAASRSPVSRAGRPRTWRSTTSSTCSPTTARTSSGELEVFAFIGRADPDPKGFAWLATLIGLFETGYIADTGFFVRDVRERHIQASGMQYRIADAIRRGTRRVRRVRHRSLRCRLRRARRPSGRRGACDARCPAQVRRRRSESGSVGAFDVAGMSELQQALRRPASGSEEHVNRELHPDDHGPHR